MCDEDESKLCVVFDNEYRALMLFRHLETPAGPNPEAKLRGNTQ